MLCRVSSPRFPCWEGWEPAADDAAGEGGLKWYKMVAEPRVERAETGNSASLCVTVTGTGFVKRVVFTSKMKLSEQEPAPRPRGCPLLADTLAPWGPWQDRTVKQPQRWPLSAAPPVNKALLVPLRGCSGFACSASVSRPARRAGGSKRLWFALAPGWVLGSEGAAVGAAVGARTGKASGGARQVPEGVDDRGEGEGSCLPSASQLSSGTEQEVLSP